VGSIRAIWAIQDRLALDDDEEKAINLKREIVAGQERIVSKPALSINAKEFDFSRAESPGSGPRSKLGIPTAWQTTVSGWRR
jgi:hypothetical protein